MLGQIKNFSFQLVIVARTNFRHYINFSSLKGKLSLRTTFEESSAKFLRRKLSAISFYEDVKDGNFKIVFIFKSYFSRGWMDASPAIKINNYITILKNNKN